MRQRWSTKALSDLDAIRDRSRQEWGAAQTASYLRALCSAVALAAQAPLRAASADHYRPGYRKVIAGAHLVFFRINGDVIEIARVLHAAMDVEPRLD
ncbi:MAG: type II toxin-antitoxin system RelE/ParE family toxin [Sphingomonas sp.]|nr:type II toxin-antitoxin system RelE/ParE family toxin [Sphingomonas sp.]